MRLKSENAEPQIKWRKSKGDDTDRRAFVFPGGCKPEATSVDDIGYSQGREGEQGQRHEDIEVENQVAEIVCPRCCAVKVRTAFVAAEEVVSDDVPGYDGEFPISERVNTNNGYLDIGQCSSVLNMVINSRIEVQMSVQPLPNASIARPSM